MRIYPPCEIVDLFTEQYYFTKLDEFIEHVKNTEGILNYVNRIRGTKPDWSEEVYILADDEFEKKYEDRIRHITKLRKVICSGKEYVLYVVANDKEIPIELSRRVLCDDGLTTGFILKEEVEAVVKKIFRGIRKQVPARFRRYIREEDIGRLPEGVRVHRGPRGGLYIDVRELGRVSEGQRRLEEPEVADEEREQRLRARAEELRERAEEYRRRREEERMQERIQEEDDEVRRELERLERRWEERGYTREYAETFKEVYVRLDLSRRHAFESLLEDSLFRLKNITPYANFEYVRALLDDIKLAIDIVFDSYRIDERLRERFYYGVTKELANTMFEDRFCKHLKRIFEPAIEAIARDDKDFADEINKSVNELIENLKKFANKNVRYSMTDFYEVIWFFEDLYRIMGEISWMARKVPKEDIIIDANSPIELEIEGSVIEADNLKEFAKKYGFAIKNQFGKDTIIKEIKNISREHEKILHNRNSLTRLNRIIYQIREAKQTTSGDELEKMLLDDDKLMKIQEILINFRSMNRRGEGLEEARSEEGRYFSFELEYNIIDWEKLIEKYGEDRIYKIIESNKFVCDGSLTNLTSGELVLCFMRGKKGYKWFQEFLEMCKRDGDMINTHETGAHISVDVRDIVRVLKTDDEKTNFRKALMLHGESVIRDLFDIGAISKSREDSYYAMMLDELNWDAVDDDYLYEKYRAVNVSRIIDQGRVEFRILDGMFINGRREALVAKAFCNLIDIASRDYNKFIESAKRGELIELKDVLSDDEINELRQIGEEIRKADKIREAVESGRYKVKKKEKKAGACNEVKNIIDRVVWFAKMKPEEVTRFGR